MLVDKVGLPRNVCNFGLGYILTRLSTHSYVGSYLSANIFGGVSRIAFKSGEYSIYVAEGWKGGGNSVAE